MLKAIFKITSIVLFILQLTISNCYGQMDKTMNDYYLKKNYGACIPLLKKLLKTDSRNLQYQEKLAICFLNTNGDRSRAITSLDYLSKNLSTPSLLFDLGRAYQYGNKFDEAIVAYTKYKSKVSGKEAAKAERAIETCNNGKELIKKPLDVTFKNLGKNVNSEFPDYYPFIPADESYITFTTRRKGGGSIMDPDGYFTSDIYLSYVKNGEWDKSKSAGSNINTAEDEQCVGMTSDGKQIMIYIDHQEAFGDIYYSLKGPKGFGNSEPYAYNVNSTSLETSASITSDGNNIVFASKKPGGLGGNDLYMCKKLPDGEWSMPLNLGPNINTKYDEDFPHLSEDNLTLYFSSEGHNSMGGFDLFKSRYDTVNNLWNKARNMGYPINTAYDEMTFCVSRTNRDGYISAVRPGGIGDLDIYKVVFNDVEDRKTLFTGKVIAGDSIKPNVDALITVEDAVTNELIGTYKPKASGKYVIILPEGEYNLSIESAEFDIFKDKIIVMGKSDFKETVQRNYRLAKKGSTPPPPDPVPVINNTKTAPKTAEKLAPVKAVVAPKK